MSGVEIPQTLKVLLIEDDPGDVRVLKQKLSLFKGCQFQLITEGLFADGLARLARDPADAVLLDLSLPDGRGIHAVTKLHEAAPALPIVALNVVENEALSLQAVREGAQDFYVKAEGAGENLGRMILLAVERKKIERDLARLASFAWKNPYVIMESDLEGHVLFLNPAGRSQFPSLLETGGAHPFLSGLAEAAQRLIRENRETMIREIELDGFFYEQHIWFVPEARMVHSYIVDNTERKKAVDALEARTREVERMNRVMIGREIKMKALKEKIRQMEQGRAA